MTEIVGHHTSTDEDTLRPGGWSSPPLLIFVGARVLMVFRHLVVAAVIGGFVALGIALSLPKEYTATASFIPDDESAIPAAVGSLVGQFAALQNQGLSPQLAGALVTEKSSLVPTVYETFPIRPEDDGIDSVRLLDRLVRPGFLGRWMSPERDSARIEAAALRRLRSRVATDIGVRTGVVTVVVTLEDPVLAAAVANRLVDRVDEFNAHTNQTRARATRQFLEERTREAGVALRRTESDLVRFHSANRNFQLSPKLALDEARLRRQVDIHQEVYLSLVQKLESARIDEVKDTPVLTRVERATPPVRKSFPRLSTFAMGGSLIGLLLVLGFAFGRAYLEWYRSEDPEGYGRLMDAVHQAQASAGRVVGRRPRGRIAEGP